MNKKYLAIILLFLTTSCIETLFVGAAATVIVVAQEKQPSETASDIWITTQIDQKFLFAGLKNPANKIGVTVDKQRVLLTGIVDSKRMVKKANSLSWRVPGVKEVIDEIQVYSKKSTIRNFLNYFKDASITAQIGTKALMSKDIASINFEVVTINKVVYLIGSAKNEREIRYLTEIAAKVIGVRKVISHISLN
ncbi:MAG: osmotically-inducible protein OsmY [Rickettsiales bacterium]|jgi:osmotically-inducible protein OsmY